MSSPPPLPTLLFALVLQACSSPPTDLALMRQRLHERMAAGPPGAVVGLAFEELATGRSLLINARR